jgi:hypothetical protein
MVVKRHVRRSNLGTYTRIYRFLRALIGTLTPSRVRIYGTQRSRVRAMTEE